LRKLIRFSAAAFLVWAVTTFAWAAISHVTGVPGPAQASRASLNLVASAVTFADPPGVLGAPQRLAARQIRQLARTIERIQRGPERWTGQLVDDLGHRHCHRRHGHRHIREVRVGRDGAFGPAFAPLVLIDGLDDAHADAPDFLQHSRERAVLRQELQERQRARIQQSLERIRARMEGVESSGKADLSPKARERLREILRRLERELERAGADVATEMETLHSDNVDAPLRVRIPNP